MVIVGHIKGDDPIEMVRGIYNKYKVGRDNRGLVIVVGYLDHSYFIAPGRNLEADLTDTETDYLASEYLIPSMKAELPDSGMLYLARGVYSLMAGKQLPQMSTLTSGTDGNGDDDDDTIFGVIGLMVLLLLGWTGYSMYAFGKYGISDSLGTDSLKWNPFSSYLVDSGGSSGSHSGSSSSSSRSSWGSSSSRSHSSGGYGGGSWGGGGSGGRW